MVQRKEILAESVKKLISLNLSDDEIVDNLVDVGIAEDEARLIIAEARFPSEQAGKKAVKSLSDVGEANSAAKKSGSEPDEEAVSEEDYEELLKEFSKKEELSERKDFSSVERGGDGKPFFGGNVPSSLEREARALAMNSGSVDIAKLWEKGVLATVDAKLGEMERLKKEIDAVIGIKVGEKFASESKKIEALLESQRALLTGKVDAVLEKKSRDVSTLIDSKIAELKEINVSVQDGMKKFDASKGVSQTLVAEVEAKIADVDRLKSSLLSEMNSELMKEQAKIEEFLKESEEMRSSLDQRINRTLELESKIIEGLLEDAKQKIDKLAIAKSDEMEYAISEEMKKLKVMESKVDPAEIQEKVKALYSAKKELSDSIDSRLSSVKDSLSKEVSLLFTEKDKEYSKSAKQLESSMEKAVKESQSSMEKAVKESQANVEKFLKDKAKELDSLAKEISPERINSTIDSLDEFKEQFIKVIDRNVESFNTAKKELAESMKKRDERINEHIKAIDRKMAELTEFEKEFASEMGVVIDKVSAAKGIDFPSGKQGGKAQGKQKS